MAFTQISLADSGAQKARGSLIVPSFLWHRFYDFCIN